MAAVQPGTTVQGPSPEQAPTPTPESRTERLVRHGRRARLYTGAVVFVALARRADRPQLEEHAQREAGLGGRLDERVARLDHPGGRRHRLAARNRNRGRVPPPHAQGLMAQRVESREDRQLRSYEETSSRAASTLRAARRLRNHQSRGFLEELRCECDRPECRATFPAAAQAHRQRPERFIVVPDHARRRVSSSAPPTGSSSSSRRTSPAVQALGAAAGAPYDATASRARA